MKDLREMQRQADNAADALAHEVGIKPQVGFNINNGDAYINWRGLLGGPGFRYD